jgi:hypothetical protein
MRTNVCLDTCVSLICPGSSHGERAISQTLSALQTNPKVCHRLVRDFVVTRHTNTGGNYERHQQGSSRGVKSSDPGGVGTARGAGPGSARLYSATAHPTGARLETKELAPGIYGLLSSKPPVDNSGFVVGEHASS